jgi:glyoxylase-like metal-dependent hydrolase (beta-lactamase superfamily II)
VWAHEYTREKVGGAEFHPIGHGDDVPAGSEVLAFDEEPGGSGTPLYLPSHAAVAVGDVFISVDGQLRVWWTSQDEAQERWYRERYVPSLRRWLERRIERVLVAHGDPVAGGADGLAAALERPPFRHD